MPGKSSLVSPRNGALVLVLAIAALGCPRTGGRIPPRAAPVMPEPAVSAPPPGPPPVPAPSEADRAIEAARGAELRGDHRTAVDTYRRATELTNDAARQAEIHYRLALLEADPNNPERHLDESRNELDLYLGTAADHPHQSEARLIAALIDESNQTRADSAAIKAELESIKAELAAMKVRLEEKEKELAGIKKVLLQNKGKP